MCIGVPVQVISPGQWFAKCRDRHGELIDVDIRLVAPPLAGAWLLTFGGAARREMDEAEAVEVLAALDSLEQAMLTQSDPLTGFADLLSRTPELPEQFKKMTISPQNPVCPLADKGFLVTDAQTLPSLINAHPTLLVLLQSDPNKHPEVADSWVIIPEILKQFPATSYTAAFADSEQSELIAREYRILKYPALLIFRQHRFVGSLAGLYSWQEYSQRVAALLTTPGYRQDIPVITQ